MNNKISTSYYRLRHRNDNIFEPGTIIVINSKKYIGNWANYLFFKIRSMSLVGHNSVYYDAEFHPKDENSPSRVRNTMLHEYLSNGYVYVGSEKDIAKIYLAN